MRLFAAKDRTFKTVRPNQGMTTEASEPRIGVRRPLVTRDEFLVLLLLDQRGVRVTKMTDSRR